ncbi:HAD-like domain protein [Raphanus sativus]|nr:HAD-like domain protein [Raphanus sativus]
MENLTTNAKSRLRGVVFDMDGTLTVRIIDFAVKTSTSESRRRALPESIFFTTSSRSADKQQKAYETIADYEKQGIDKLQIMSGCNKTHGWGLITRNVKKAIDIFHQRFDLEQQIVQADLDNSSSKVTEALCFRIVKVLEFVAKKESLQLPHGFTAFQQSNDEFLIDWLMNVFKPLNQKKC